MDKLDFIQIKNFALRNTLSREWEDKLPQIAINYFQKAHLIKDCHPKCTKPS